MRGISLTREDYIKDIEAVLSRLRPYTEIMYGNAKIKNSYTVEYGGVVYTTLNNRLSMVEHILKANDYFIKEELNEIINE